MNHLNSSPWYLTIVYGSPHFTPRQALWDDLQEVYNEVDGPWAFLGDFNAILIVQERIGPPLVRDQQLEAGFQATVDECDLIDIGFNGDMFTWARGGTRKGLDRGLCNLDWRIRFEDSEITHLPEIKSDHTPLLLNFDYRRRDNRGRRPFRFEAVWLTHPNFNQLMVDNWRGHMNNLSLQLKELQGVLKEWNKDTFGNIFCQKKELFHQLKDIDKRLLNGWNDHLLNLQKSTWKAYEDILAKEEILWFQKSRAKWIDCRDRNTKYFHGVTTIRRRRINIATLQNQRGSGLIILNKLKFL